MRLQCALLRIMDIKIIRSKRKTVSLEVTREGAVILRAPEKMSDKEIRAFVDAHTDWLNKAVLRQAQREPVKEYTAAEKQEMVRRVKQIIKPKVEHYSALMGLYPEAVTVTTANTRYGSCSGKNRVCFSYMLADVPEQAVDYVVVHELAHIRYHNHSKDFYALVEKFFPDYKEAEKLLKKR